MTRRIHELVIFVLNLQEGVLLDIMCTVTLGTDNKGRTLPVGKKLTMRKTTMLYMFIVLNESSSAQLDRSGNNSQLPKFIVIVHEKARQCM